MRTKMSTEERQAEVRKVFPKSFGEWFTARNGKDYYAVRAGKRILATLSIEATEEIAWRRARSNIRNDRFMWEIEEIWESGDYSDEFRPEQIQRGGR